MGILLIRFFLFRNLHGAFAEGIRDTIRTFPAKSGKRPVWKPPPRFHREIKGRFRKRVVLANVPSFRFSFRGNMRTYPRSGFRSGQHPNVPSFRFSFRGNIRQNHPFGNHPFMFPPSFYPLSRLQLCDIGALQV